MASLLPSLSVAARPGWEEELSRSFPGWLLPASGRQALPVAVAERFFARLTGRRDHLQLLRAASLLQAEQPALERFLDAELPALLRVLPAQARVVQRTWEGGFQGRLDLRATRRLHESGQTTRFVTRARRRDLALPENLLVRWVCARLDLALRRVLSAATEARHWRAPLARRAQTLRTLQAQTTLHEIPRLEQVTRVQVQAAQRARHPAYRTAAQLALAIHDALDSADPARVAPYLAAGALWPLQEARRFELAVLCRLLDRMGRRLGMASDDAPDAQAQRPWAVQHDLIVGQRDAVATFQRRDGARVEIYADTAPDDLLPGRRHALASHYLGASRQRPDLSIRRVSPDGSSSWALVEVKHTANPSYLATGLGEALLYAHEFGGQLAGWPQVVLVGSSGPRATLLTEDSVVAVGWDQWASPALVNGLLGGLAPDAAASSMG